MVSLISIINQLVSLSAWTVIVYSIEIDVQIN